MTRCVIRYSTSSNGSSIIQSLFPLKFIKLFKIKNSLTFTLSEREWRFINVKSILQIFKAHNLRTRLSLITCELRFNYPASNLTLDGKGPGLNLCRDTECLVGCEVPTAVVVESSIIKGITRSMPLKSKWYFEETCHIHLQVQRISQESEYKLY
jgi:hypothetical protein